MQAVFDSFIGKNIAQRNLKDANKKFPILEHNNKAREAAERLATVGVGMNRVFLKPLHKRIDRIVYLGIATVALDDICDVSDGSVLTSLKWLKNKINPEGNDMLNKMIDKVIYWQKESLKQKEDISKEEIWKITKNKGGYSGLVFLYTIETNPANVMKRASFDFGTMIQLIDDWMDMDVDKKEGVKTMFTQGYFGTKDLFYYIGKVARKYAWHPQIGMLMLEIPSIFVFGLPK